MAAVELTPTLYAVAALFGVTGFGIGGITVTCLLIHSHVRLRRTAQAATYAATHDYLTGLPNRRHFQDRAEQMLTSDRATLVALFADLNNFKHVNDELGHEVGDEVLMLAGRIFSEHLSPHGIVGRRSGDEFIALVKAPSGAEPTRWIHAVITPMAAQLRRIYNISTSLGQSGASIGVYIAAPEGTYTARKIFRRADAATYEAKKNRAGIVYWHSDLEQIDGLSARSSARLRDWTQETG